MGLVEHTMKPTHIRIQRRWRKKSIVYTFCIRNPDLFQKLLKSSHLLFLFNIFTFGTMYFFLFPTPNLEHLQYLVARNLQYFFSISFYSRPIFSISFYSRAGVSIRQGCTKKQKICFFSIWYRYRYRFDYNDYIIGIF